MSLSQVQAQWDIGVSSFTLSDRLLSLIKAATIDDVQPLAVIAAEAIGTCLEVDPHLTGRAADVLGSSQSYRVENLKLTMGLSSGGIARQLRQSPSATRTFVLISLLQAHLDIHNLAELLFEILIHSGLHNKVSTSTSQLKGLCIALQGFSNHFNEIENQQTKTWDLVLPSLAGLAKPQFWKAIVPEEGAKLFLELFRILRDDDLDRVLLKGANSGNWLAIILCQVLPGRCNIVDYQHQTVYNGSEGRYATVVIQLDEKCKEWSLEKFYRVRSVVDVLHIQPDTSSIWFAAGCPRPWPNFVHTRTLYEVCLCRYFEMDATLLNAAEIVGIAYVLLLLRSNFGNGRYTRSFREICRPDFESNLRFFTQRLGWPDDAASFEQASSFASSVQEYCTEHDIRGLNVERRHWYAEPGQWCVLEVISDMPFQSFLQNQSQYSGQGSRVLITNVALIIVRFILLHSVSSVQPGTIDVGSDELWEDLMPLECFIYETLPAFHLSGPNYVSTPSQFLQQIWHSFGEKFPKPNQGAKQLLAISSRGYVAYLKCLRDIPSLPADACAIVIHYGSLRWRDQSYKCLYDGRVHAISFGQESTNGIVDLTSAEGYDLSWRSSLPTSFQIQPFNDLGVLNWTCRSTRCGHVGHSYHDAVTGFVLAHRFKPASLSVNQEIQSCVAAGILQIPYGNSRAYADDKKRLIATYSGDPVADFLRYSIHSENRIVCLVQGLTSIRSCVLEAEKLYPEGNWIVMSNE